jgi:ketosteroid isomerase-like protein
LIDAGTHVVAVARICGCLRGSGHQVEVEETQVWKMQEGRATEVRAYLTRSHALKAVGLAE